MIAKIALSFDFAGKWASYGEAFRLIGLGVEVRSEKQEPTSLLENQRKAAEE